MHTYQAGSSPEALAPDAGPTGEILPVAAIAAAIWARRLAILIVALVAAAAGLVWASFQPRVYEASVTLMVADSKMRDGGQTTTTAGYLPLLANRAMAQRLIRELGLDTKYGLTPTTFLAAVRVDEVRSAPLVTVRVRLGDPDLAARVANRFADMAIELNRNLNQKDTSVARDMIKAQLDEAAARLESARASMLTFRREAQVELSRADITAVLEQRQQRDDWMVSLATEKARLAQLERDLARQPATLTGTRSAPADADLVAAINDAARDTSVARPLRPADTLVQPDGGLPPGKATPDEAMDALRQQDARHRQADHDQDQARRQNEDQRRRAEDERRADEVPALPAGDGRANPVRLLLDVPDRDGAIARRGSRAAPQGAGRRGAIRRATRADARAALSGRRGTAAARSRGACRGEGLRRSVRTLRTGAPAGRGAQRGAAGGGSRHPVAATGVMGQREHGADRRPPGAGGRDRRGLARRPGPVMASGLSSASSGVPTASVGRREEGERQ